MKVKLVTEPDDASYINICDLPWGTIAVVVGGHETEECMITDLILRAGQLVLDDKNEKREVVFNLSTERIFTINCKDKSSDVKVCILKKNEKIELRND